MAGSASLTAAWTQGQTVDYRYDVFDRLVGKTVDAMHDGTVDAQDAYVYDGQDVVLQFRKTGAGAMANAESRFLRKCGAFSVGQIFNLSCPIGQIYNLSSYPNICKLRLTFVNRGIFRCGSAILENVKNAPTIGFFDARKLPRF